MTLEEAFDKLLSDRQLMDAEIDASTRSQLVEYGVVVEDGVLTLKDVELLDADSIKTNLEESTSSWVQRIDIATCTESTNSDLLDWSRMTQIDGWIRLAEVQTQGRGRRGRRWVSPVAKNIALSIGVVVDRPTAEIGAISLAIGLQVASVLERMDISDVKLKWPNDLLIGQRKVGGILIELADTNRAATLIVGIGLNVSYAPDVDVTRDYRATRIADHSAIFSRNYIVSQLIDATYLAIRRFEVSGFEWFKKDWEERDWLRGKHVVLKGAEPPIEGIGLGVDSDGGYRIQSNEGTKRAIGGELSLRLNES